MNIDLNTAIQAGSVIIAVLVMVKSNNQIFKGVKEDIADLAKKMDDNRQEAKEALASVHGQVNRDIDFVRDSLAGTKNQMKDEIYPRLNAAEKYCEKNCRAMIDHQKLCDDRHKRLQYKET